MMVKCWSRQLSLLTVSLLLACSTSYAAPNNFRFALPETYQPYMMQEHPAFLGSVLTLIPAEVSEPQQGTGYRNLRVLVIKDTLQNLGFSTNAQGYRNFAQAALEGLHANCQEPSMNISAVIQLSGGLAFDWRRQCLSAESTSLYLSEQGRLFISDNGVYGLSQFGFNTNRSATISERERNWFAKFTFNSSFCQSGANCGDEGLLKYWVDYQP